MPVIEAGAFHAIRILCRDVCQAYASIQQSVVCAHSQCFGWGDGNMTPAKAK